MFSYNSNQDMNRQIVKSYTKNKSKYLLHGT